MSIATAWSTALDILIDDVDGLGLKCVVTATAAGAIAITTNQTLGRGGASIDPNSLEGGFLYIPSGTGTDQVHAIDTVAVSGLTLTFTTNGNYSNTLTGVTAYVLSFHPDYLRNLANEALKKEVFECTVPLSMLGSTDNDLDAATTAAYTDSSATSSKVTTSANNLDLRRAMRVLNSGANGYTESGALTPSTSSPFIFWAIGRAAVGTAVAALRGASADIESMSTTESRLQYLYKTGTFGSSDESVTVRLGGLGASDDSYWVSWALLPTSDTIVPLPTWVDKRFKMKALLAGDFNFSSGSNAYDAFTRSLAPLAEGTDWHFVSDEGSANSFWVELDRASLNRPLWVRGLRPYYDQGAITADSDTSTCPLNKWVLRCEFILGERFPGDYPGLRAKAAMQITQNASVDYQRQKPQRNVMRTFG